MPKERRRDTIPIIDKMPPSRLPGNRFVSVDRGTERKRCTGAERPTPMADDEVIQR